MKLSQRQIEKIKKLYKSGKSINEIIKILNISTTTIYKYLQDIPKQRRSKSKNPIIVPKMNEQLGECAGIFYGDGTMWKEKREACRIRIRGNPADEKEYYNNWVKPLFEKIFRVKCHTKYFNGGSYGVEINSKELGRFFNKKFKFPFGKKSFRMLIPNKISKSENATIGFIRGLFDTDGYIYFNIVPSKVTKSEVRFQVFYLAFTSCNKYVLEQVKKALNSLGLKGSKIFKDTSQKKNPKFSLRLEWKENFFGYANRIGFHNPRFLDKLKRIEEIIRNEKDSVNKFSYLSVLSNCIKNLNEIKMVKRNSNKNSSDGC